MLQWSTESISKVIVFLAGRDCGAENALMDLDSLRAFDDESLGCASLLPGYLVVSYEAILARLPS